METSTLAGRNEIILNDALIDFIPNALVIFDKDWYIVKMNNKAKSIFLFPEDYMTSKPFWEIAPQYINTEVFKAMHQAKKENKEVNIEFSGTTSGRWFDMNINTFQEFVIVCIRDISAIKHTQNELLRLVQV